MALKTCIDTLQHALDGAGSGSVPATPSKETVSSDKAEKSALPKPSQQNKSSRCI